MAGPGSNESVRARFLLFSPRGRRRGAETLSKQRADSSGAETFLPCLLLPPPPPPPCAEVTAAADWSQVAGLEHLQPGPS